MTATNARRHPRYTRSSSDAREHEASGIARARLDPPRTDESMRRTERHAAIPAPPNRSASAQRADWQARLNAAMQGQQGPS